MNGMTCVVADYDPATRTATLCDEDGRVVRVPPGKLGHLRRAFAMTVHKAQGAEVPVVVTVLHRSGTHPSCLRARCCTPRSRAPARCP